MKRSEEAGLSRLKILAFASLFVSLASTVFISVLAFQISTHPAPGTTTSSSRAVGPDQLIGQPVSATTLAELTRVSARTLSAVGRGPVNVTSPSTISNSMPLLSSGKPEVLYIGGEFCPFCAAERWSLIVALSKFGNFSGLEYMLSSSTDTYPDTSTFTFTDSNYSSPYLVFIPVELQNRTHATVRTLTANQSALFNQYDSQHSIPFVDLGNKYSVTGSQFSPIALRTGGIASGASYGWDAVASQLDKSNSTLAQNIDGAANRLISAICNLTGGLPSDVCTSSFAMTLSYIHASSSSTLLTPACCELHRGDWYSRRLDAGNS